MRVRFAAFASLAVFLLAATVAGDAPPWVDNFHDASLVLASSRVVIGGGTVVLSAAPLVRQGLQLGSSYELNTPRVVPSGSSYLLYYAECSGSCSIAVATSSDLQTWQEIGVVINPGFSGSTDSGGVSYEDVILVGSVFHMWYSGLGPGGFYAIHHATSPNGLNWTARGVVISSQTIGTSGHVAMPTVLWDGSQFTMWFTAYSGSSSTDIRWATSADGSAWLQRGRVLAAVQDGLDNAGPREPTVVRTSYGLTMWYACVAVWEGTLCRARSLDGGNWSREGAVLSPDPNIAGEDRGVATPGALQVSPGSFRIWYVGRGPLNQIYSALGSGELASSGSIESVPIILPQNATWGTLVIQKKEPQGASVKVSVLNFSSGQPLAGLANLTITAVSLAGVANDPLMPIALQATLGGDGQITPEIQSWSIVFGGVSQKPTPVPNLDFAPYIPLLFVAGGAGGGAAIGWAFIELTSRKRD